MINTIFNGLDVMQSLVEIDQCVPTVGAKIWCFFCFFLNNFFNLPVCHAPSPSRS